MESVQSIKNRVRGIASTRQITQSMRLVSTSKVQKARERMLQNLPFAQGASDLVRAIACGWDSGHHRYLHGQRSSAGKTAVVILSGDRGLCGGYNINVAKEAFSLMEEREGKFRVVTVGLKAAEYVRRQRVKVARSFTGVSETPLYEDARDIADLLLGWFDAGEVDEVWLLGTKFHSMLSQSPGRDRLLPVELTDCPIGREVVRFEQDSISFLEEAVSYALAARLYAAMLEAAACEQSARITSMDSAVKNADEMIQGLSLKLNQARQGAITNEIIEIVSGASAVESEGKGG